MAEITTAGVPNLECRHTLGVSEPNPRDVKLVSGKKYNIRNLVSRNVCRARILINYDWGVSDQL